MLMTTPAMPCDGRQSAVALAVSRGAQRLPLSLGLACVSELPLASGRRADLVALGGDGEVWIVEIKSSVEDFRADQKWPDYRMHCDRLFFATAPHVPAAIPPDEAGLILADGFGAALVRTPRSTGCIPPPVAACCWPSRALRRCGCRRSPIRRAPTKR